MKKRNEKSFAEAVEEFEEGDTLPPEEITEAMCRAQGLRIVSCEGIGLGGLAKENNESSTELFGEGE